MSKRLSTNEVRKRLSAFASQWQHAAREEADEKLFTADFLACFDIAKHQYEREFVVTRLDGSKGYMDGFIPGKLLIEGKSLGKDLKKARQQADEYRWACPAHQQPRWVLLHDFGRFALFDLVQDASYQCALADLPQKADWFKFLVSEAAPVIVEETEADRKAAEQMAALHEALLRSNFKGRELEVFLTRLLFCLFADDTAIFGDNHLFSQLLNATRADGADVGERLAKLFDVLNQPKDDRSKLLDEDLAAFEYINGQLFAERTRCPDFDSTLRQLILQCASLDWSRISPAIFGAMFQGVLEQSEPDLSRTASRRELGAHYTSERNILRAINPLFMDGLRAELQAAGSNRAKLQALYDKLPTIKILDPACGCGNFLVIAYRELRLLENDLIDKLFSKGGQSKGLLDVSSLSRVTVDQFYGIEIDASAAHIAQVAMWITDHQMNLQTAARFGTTRPSIPLTQTAHIHHGNALRTDWAEVLPPQQCSFVVGNPPFVGKKEQNREQKADLELLTAKIKGAGVLDYVTGWYFKATAYMQRNPQVLTAFVSTNSITQGEQVGILWGELLKHGVQIHFAHRTFKWSNEGRGVAAVHCVIIGFALQAPDMLCRIFDYSNDIKDEGVFIKVNQINPYLVDAANILIEKRGKPLNALASINYGSMAIDDGHLILDADAKKQLLNECHEIKPYIRQFMGAQEFLNSTPRWCLWMIDAPPNLIRDCEDVRRRVAAVKKFRTESNRPETNKLAAIPALFGEIRQPKNSYL
ncbi:MAG: N-6 DNA methylase, partial [Brachymonas sp.]|nr:N-6 DNA methylase [Brachymonas sp.]